MIIDESSRAALDALISGKPDLPKGVYSFQAALSLIPLDEVAAQRVIRSLLSSGLLELAHDQRGNEAGVALSQRGLCYKELQKLESKARWKERVIGFAFGVLTSVVATAILSFLVA